MRHLLEQFSGMETRPDPAEVGSRFSRNVTFGPRGTWIESRPGTEHLTYMLQPSTADGPEPPDPPTPPPVLGDEGVSNTLFTAGTYTGPAGGWMELDNTDTNITSWTIIGPATHTGVQPIEIDWNNDPGFVDLYGSPGWGGVSQVVSLTDTVEYRLTVKAKRNPGGPSDIRRFQIDLTTGTDPDAGTSLVSEIIVAQSGAAGAAGAVEYTFDVTAATTGDHIVAVRAAPLDAGDAATYGIFTYEVSIRVITSQPPPPTPPTPPPGENAGVFRLKDSRIREVCAVIATHDADLDPNGPSLVCPVVFMPLGVVGFGGDVPQPPASNVFEYWGNVSYYQVGSASPFNPNQNNQLINYDPVNAGVISDDDVIELEPFSATADINQNGLDPSTEISAYMSGYSQNDWGFRALTFRRYYYAFKVNNPESETIGVFFRRLDVPGNVYPNPSLIPDVGPGGGYWSGFCFQPTFGDPINPKNPTDGTLNMGSFEFVLSDTGRFPAVTDMEVAAESSEWITLCFIGSDISQKNRPISSSGEHPVIGGTDPTEYISQLVQYMQFVYYPLSSPGSETTIDFAVKIFEDAP